MEIRDWGLSDEASVDEASVDEASVDEASVDEASVDEASVDEASVDEASVDEASVDVPLEMAVRFLALGDSYTIGEGVVEGERWPVQLARRLRDGGIEVDELTIIAQTGWTTAELSAGIARKRPTGVYDLVTLLIGVNNQYRGLSQESYRQEFVALLEQAIAFAGGDSNRVIVLSIPDWGVTPFAADQNRPAEVVAAEINAFNTINREEAARRGVHYVDVTAMSRQAESDSSWLAEDSLHPSAKMYAQWAELVLTTTRRALNGD